MKLPRDISGDELSRLLKKLGYTIVRQSGSHIRLTTIQKGEHHITIPSHDPLKIGTLSSILSDIAEHFEVSKQDLINQLF